MDVLRPNNDSLLDGFYQILRTGSRYITITSSGKPDTINDMRMLVLLVIGLAVAGVIAFFFMQQQKEVQGKVVEQQISAQEAADAYRKNQADMMKKLEQ